jgi:hypothetical protein
MSTYINLWKVRSNNGADYVNRYRFEIQVIPKDTEDDRPKAVRVPIADDVDCQTLRLGSGTGTERDGVTLFDITNDELRELANVIQKHLGEDAEKKESVIDEAVEYMRRTTLGVGEHKLSGMTTLDEVEHQFSDLLYDVGVRFGSKREEDLRF